MSERPNSRNTTNPDAQSDTLLWIGAGVVAAIGAAWLVMTQIGAGSTSASNETTAATGTTGDRRPPEDATAPAGGTAPENAADPTASPAASATLAGNAAPATGTAGLDNPLRAAQMAHEAGMLIEPENYSAWRLYSSILDGDAANAAAREGLEQVATDLLARADTAFEQGRYDDAAAIATRILSRLPEHDATLTLNERLEREAARQLEQQRERAAARRRAAAEAERAASSAAAPAPVVTAAALGDLQTEFEAAVAANRLLAPSDESARKFVEDMRAIDADDERTLAAADWLITEMLNRSRQSAEANDWEAAATWIEEAGNLGAAEALLDENQAYLAGRMVDAESRKRLPASELTVVTYVQPEYPRLALSRQAEGWVDVDFRVTTDGRTSNVMATDGSHDRMFRDEAVEAVRQWRFEPREYLGRPIAQSAYTRLRFVITD